MRSLALAAALVGCAPEYQVRDEPPTPPAEPPGDVLDDFGDPPNDWTACDQGYLARYFNLPVNHPDLEPALEAAVVHDPDTTDWFDEEWAAFDRFEPSLDFGGQWWPVDEGLDGDPAYFSAAFTAWMRVWDPGEHDLVLGAGGDAWVLLDGELAAEAHHLDGFDSEVLTLDLDAGVYPLEVRFTHRTADADGFRFRTVSPVEAVSVCYPEFGP
jgi:hypothetical protein